MTALRNVAAIVGKEWRHYFGSPIAWVALFVWTLLFGIFFYFAFTFFLEQSMRVAQQGMEMGGGGMKLSLNEYLIRPLFHNMAVVALFVAPMLTMRLFAEEKRQGTIELLATSPITDLQIVIGKFLAAAGPLRAHDPRRARERGPHLDLRVEPARVEARPDRRPRPLPARQLLPRDGHLRLHPHQEPDRGRHPLLLPLPRDVDARLGRRPHGRARSRRSSPTSGSRPTSRTS